ncbi:SCO family protein [Thiocapsa rosea]|uniref:Protein SCO1/2 n=1 Tax=Thiocapsa rosea TaxID=69360 RepID=A0A495VCG4_9GAMM|nr:SCO family protein [Thiocapsa rosea]RKT47101.1 protein SCO1/2 [Thiocapsa rosea]
MSLSRTLAALVVLLMIDAEDVSAGPLGGDFTLIDQHEAPFALADARGRVVILTFGYAFCPDICPTTLAMIAEALRRLGDQSERVQPLFVSLDPGRDTSSRLRDYAGFFHPRLIALTGSAERLREVAELFGVRYAFVDEGAGGHYTLDHSASIYVLNPEGRLARILPYGLPVEEIVRAVRDLLVSAEPAD